MSKTVAPTLTRADLDKIADTIQKVVRDNKDGALEKRYIELLQQIVKTLHELKLTVEFEHERRLQAIEDYLQDM